MFACHVIVIICLCFACLISNKPQQVVMSLNGKIQVCIPQSLSKVISGNVQNGGIPNFNNSSDASHYATRNDDEKMLSVPTIPAVETARILANIENVLNVHELHLSPTAIKREQNEDLFIYN